MADGIIYPKGVVPRREDFREAQKMRGEVYNFLKNTMEETVESTFSDMGYKQKAQPAGYYGDGSAFGFGVDDHVYNVKVGSKADSYLEKRIGLGGKRIVCELHMTMYPESMTVEMHYKNTEDAAFRGFQESSGPYMINEKIIISCANMDKFKSEMTKKLKEFAEKEVGYITRTKLGNEDRMEKSTASVVEGFSLKSLFTDNFETTSNKINESISKFESKDEDDIEADDLLLGDINEEEFVTHGTYTTSNFGGYEIQLSDDGDGARLRYHGGEPSDWLEIQHDEEEAYVVDPDNGEKLELSNFIRVNQEVTTAGAGAGSAGNFGYDAPLGAPRKRSIKTSAPYDQPVNESVTDEYEETIAQLTNDYFDGDEMVKKAAIDWASAKAAGVMGGRRAASSLFNKINKKYSPEVVSKAIEVVQMSNDDFYLSESFIQDLDEAKKQAMDSSKSGGAKYVNLHGANNYTISDHYDRQTTVATFQNGNQLQHNGIVNESVVKKYQATLKHDGGKFKLTTTASSEEAAKDKICKAEGCPKSAILSIKEVPMKESLTINEDDYHIGIPEEVQNFYPPTSDKTGKIDLMSYRNNGLSYGYNIDEGKFYVCESPANEAIILSIVAECDTWKECRKAFMKAKNETIGENVNIDKSGDVFTIKNAKGKTFSNWEQAMHWLVDEMKKEEDLYYYISSNLSTNDTLVVGNVEFAGIDVMDHLKLVKENTTEQSRRRFEDTPYARRLSENRRPTNMRIIPEGKDGDGFWTVVSQDTLDAYKKNHIMGAPGAEGVEVNSKEEEEYNSGGMQKFPGGKAVKKKKNESKQSKLDKQYAEQYMQIDESVRKRYKPSREKSQEELNDRWKRLATIQDSETIRMAESVTPDVDPEPEPVRPITESEEGLKQLSRNNNLEEGDIIEGKRVIEIEKPNCLAPVYYKVFKEDYENKNRAFIWDFNTGTLVNNPGFEAK